MGAEINQIHGGDPLEKEMATHFSFLAWESQGQRSLAGYSSWSHKESDATEVTWYTW